jgi:HAE1 family hydrophobic/amphiphilic exporter-1
LSIGCASVVFSLVLYKVIDKDFLPLDDTGYIQGFSQARDGTSPFLMETYHDQINQLAAADPNITSAISISSYTNVNQGIFFFKLKPYKKRASMNETIKELSHKAKEVTGLRLFLSPLPLINLTAGSTSQAIYQYSLTSIDQKTLFEYGPKLTQKMRVNPLFSQVSSDLRNNQPLWKFEILRDKAANYNVTARGIENYLGWAYSDNKISQINGKMNQYSVILETLPEFYQDPNVLSKLYISSNRGALVPLSELVRTTETVGPLTINHVNGLSAVNISFNPATDVPLGTVLKEIEKITHNDFPPQVSGQLIGTAKIFNDSFLSLNFLILISFFVIYIVLGVLYESFIHPITVMSTLPPTLFGGLFTLYLFGETLSIYSFVGLILLIGIVLKNGIMIVDFANGAIKNENKTAYDAIIEACLIRFRPILMTTLAAIMGALPIALGIGGSTAQSRISLGLCIVGGLIVSQLLTLFLTPVIYYYFETAQEKLHKRFKTTK